MSFFLRIYVCLSLVLGCFLATNTVAEETEGGLESSRVCSAAADCLANAAKSGKDTKVAVLPFMCNGKASTPIADAVRGKLLEELVDKDGIQCFDRNEVELVATEAGLSCPESAMASAQAVLIGEVFCSPSTPEGYVAYRLIATADSKILAVGFDKVKWDEDEVDMFSGSVRGMSYDSFALVNSSQLSALQKKAAKLNTARVAMVYDGSQNAENTLEARMAFIQVLQALHRAHIALYEREFFQGLAQENALDGKTANGGAGITAVGHTKLKRSKGDSNTVEVQVLGVPGNNLLLSTQIKQAKGTSVSSETGDDGDNDFKRRLDKVARDESDIKLVYEAEVIIDENYSLPKKLYRYRGGIDISENGSYWESYDWHSSGREINNIDQRTVFEEALRCAHRSTPDNTDRIKRLLQLGALYGVSNGGRTKYTGPVSLCFTEIRDSFNLIGGKPFEQPPHYGYDLDKPLELKGTYKKGDYCYDYEFSIQWRDGLPYKAKAKMDLTPMKDKLIKKTRK